MPTYEYKCLDCSNIWVEVHSISVNNAVEELGIKCTNCQSININKYLGNYGTATVVFKGTGWAHKDLLLDKIGMPSATRNSPEAQAAMKKRL
jgi:predicted nucleic acid-binding Zn ribbon protein